LLKSTTRGHGSAGIAAAEGETGAADWASAAAMKAVAANAAAISKHRDFIVVSSVWFVW